MGLIETFKDVFTLVQKADNIELTNKIISLQTDVMAVLEENRTIKDKARSLEEALELKAQMQFDDDAYWTGAGRNAADGPYCPRCFDVDRKSVRMIQGFGYFFACTHCKISVEITSVKPPKR